MKQYKKACRRTIITAIAVMLCIGSAAAWFAVGSRAKMNGMTVRIAEGESGGIVLCTSGKGTYTDFLTIEAETVDMLPCTTADGENFFTVKDGVSANGTSAGEVDRFSVETVESVSGTEYINEFWIYVKSSDATEYANLSVSDIILSGNGAEDAISAALRVSVTYNGETKIYVPLESSTTAYKSISNVTGNPVTVNTNQLGEPFESGVTGSYKQIIVKAWYEGQDSACTSENRANTTGNVNITVEFSAE